jgi:hypothetical protein
MSNTEDKSVPANPIRVRWVMPENFLEQKMGYWSQRNCRTRVAITNFFNRVSSKNSRGINRFLV